MSTPAVPEQMRMYSLVMPASGSEAKVFKKRDE
jgi:hypothetical protein